MHQFHLTINLIEVILQDQINSNLKCRDFTQTIQSNNNLLWDHLSTNGFHILTIKLLTFINILCEWDLLFRFIDFIETFFFNVFQVLVSTFALDYHLWGVLWFGHSGLFWTCKRHSRAFYHLYYLDLYRLST